MPAQSCKAAARDRWRNLYDGAASGKSKTPPISVTSLTRRSPTKSGGESGIGGVVWGGGGGGGGGG